MQSREIAKAIINQSMDMMTYFETDEEEITETENKLTEEIRQLDKSSCLYSYLKTLVED